MEVKQGKIGILLSEGFHFLQARYPLLRLAEEGFLPKIIGPEMGELVPSKDSREGLEASLTYSEALRQHWDLLIVPGGMNPNEILKNFIHEVYSRGSFVAAVDSGVNILAQSGVLENCQCSARRLPFMDVILAEAGAQRSELPVTLDQRTLTAEEIIHLPLFVLKIFEILNNQH